MAERCEGCGNHDKCETQRQAERALAEARTEIRMLQAALLEEDGDE